MFLRGKVPWGGCGDCCASIYKFTVMGAFPLGERFLGVDVVVAMPGGVASSWNYQQGAAMGDHARSLLLQGP